MVNKICEMKNEILKHVDSMILERGVDRMDVDRVGKMIDMVHHLAESESNCWQAEYYRTVTEAMNSDKYGYSSMPDSRGFYNTGGGTGSSAGYSRMSNGSKDFREIIPSLRDVMREAKPDDREKMRNEIMSIVGVV